ncbi:hypothetical protein BH09GEM1_BH09GEM1_45040 [soil metagenome]
MMTAWTASSSNLGDADLHIQSGAEQILSMPALESLPRKWTEEEFYAARDAAPPSSERWELVDGELLVTPGPHWTHQRLAFWLAHILEPYVSTHALGTVFLSPCDVRFEPGLIMQPDTFVVPAGHLRSRSDVVTRLLLASEVLSPSSTRFDRVIKRPRYQRHKVPEYWVIDGESQTIERWQPEDERPALIADQLQWHPTGASEPFVLDVPAFFRDALAGVISEPA